MTNVVELVDTASSYNDAAAALTEHFAKHVLQALRSEGFDGGDIIDGDKAIAVAVGTTSIYVDFTVHGTAFGVMVNFVPALEAEPTELEN